MSSLGEITKEVDMLSEQDRQKVFDQIKENL